MKTYIANDTNEYFDIVKILEKESIQEATIIITNDVAHSHLIRHLTYEEIIISGENKPKYTIYIDPRDNFPPSPYWYFNSTSLFYSNNVGISFINLHFNCFIQDYDYIRISEEYDLKTNKNIEIVDYENEQSFNSFSILFIDFINSKINFKDCKLENKTNRTFEISAKEQSKIIFENCTFDGDFKFIFDIDSEIIIKKSESISHVKMGYILPKLL